MKRDKEEIKKEIMAGLENLKSELEKFKEGNALLEKQINSIEDNLNEIARITKRRRMKKKLVNFIRNLFQR